MFRKITKLIVLAAVSVLAAVACEKKEAPVQPYLDVNPHTISGEWELVLLNGHEILEGSYIRVEFIRNEQKFILKDGMNGFADAPRVYEGKFNITEVDGVGAVIEGLYDHGLDFWKEKYVVSELTDKSMKFTGMKTGEVQVYSKTAR